jgi:acyl carrier protein
MTKPEIVDKLREMMKQTSQENVDWDSVTTESNIESLGFDSLAILDLIYDIQQEFGLEFDAEEMAGVDTVGKLADFLKEKGA